MHDAANDTLSRNGIIDQSRPRGGMRVSILSMLCGLLLWPVAGFAELYKWTDEQGNLHITDIPPPPSQKKPPPPVTRPPQSAPSQKATSSAGFPEWPHEPVIRSATLTKEPPVQPMMGELSPRQATLMSAWQLFEGREGDTKAPVHRWTDERGLDRFSDVRPTGKSQHGVVGKPERTPERRREATAHMIR